MKRLMVLPLVMLLISLILFVPRTEATTITVGTIGVGMNAVPFGGTLQGYPGTVYQQVYNQELFPAMSITGVTFFNSFGGTIDGATYTINLSTTTKAVNNLDTTNLAANVGPDSAQLWTGYLSGNPGSSFTFTGPAFAYDPAKGNLLVEILKNGGSSFTLADSPSYFDSMNGSFGTNSSRAHDFGTGFASRGLVTQFNAVPLPGSFLLFGPALAGLAVIRRRFKK
jgi:hypothetical protein